MDKQLDKLENRYQELEQLLGSEEVASNNELYSKLAKELSDLQEPVQIFRQYKKVCADIAGLEHVLKEKHDPEFLEMARLELEELNLKKAELTRKLEDILRPEDKDAGKDVIVEIRQGTGGDEAGLFVADLFRMYTKYAVLKGWTVETLFLNPTEAGGFKDLSFSVKGKDAYKRLKFEHSQIFS